MANRNRKEINRVIFERLVNRCLRQEQSLLNASERRFIACEHDAERELMSSAEVESTTLTHTLRFVQIRFEEKVYYILFGVSEIDFNIEGLIEIELTPGIFCLASYVSGVPCTSDYFKIKDVIEARFIGDETDYHGHSVEEISPLFPICQVFLVESDNQILKEYPRALGIVLSQTLGEGALDLYPNTLSSFNDLFESGSPYVPFKNIINGLIAISWDVLFLQLYRCIEQLYAQPKTAQLKENSELSTTSHSLVDIAEFLEVYLSWRPKEEDALQKLFAKAEYSISYEIGLALDLISIDENGEYVLNGKPISNPCNSVATGVYKLRNSIVHYRPLHKTHDFDEKRWNALVCGMLKMIKQLYADLGAAFFEKNLPQANL